jgi:hypothetical protein
MDAFVIANVGARRIVTLNTPWKSPGECHLFIAEGCHLYIALTHGCRITVILENRQLTPNELTKAQLTKAQLTPRLIIRYTLISFFFKKARPYLDFAISLRISASMTMEGRTNVEINLAL